MKVSLKACTQPRIRQPKTRRANAPMMVLHSFIAAIMSSFTSLISGVSSNSENDRNKNTYDEALARNTYDRWLSSLRMEI